MPSFPSMVLCGSYTYPESYISREKKKMGSHRGVEKKLKTRDRLEFCIIFFHKISDEACFSKKDIFVL